MMHIGDSDTATDSSRANGANGNEPFSVDMVLKSMRNGGAKMDSETQQQNGRRQNDVTGASNSKTNADRQSDDDDEDDGGGDLEQHQQRKETNNKAEGDDDDAREAQLENEREFDKNDFNSESARLRRANNTNGKFLEYE